MHRGTYLSREAAIGAIEELRKDPRAEGKQDKIEKILLKYGADEDDTDPDEGLYASMYTNDIRNAYEDILDVITKNLVDVYVKVASGWELLYEQIPEDIAQDLWQTGFATGENKISIETETSKRLREYNKRQLGIKSSTTVKAPKKRVKANDYLSDEDKEILRRADTSDWSEMQNEYIQDEIDRAGSYSRYIDKEKKSRINASKYYEDTDTYVVKIWHEVDGMRGGFPDAAEEIFDIVAGSPDEALERAKMMWKGPIDRIEIVDVNPEYEDEQMPFNAATDVDDDIITFNEWVESQYGEGFDPSGLSDEEFYELEDYYREDVPVNRREYAYR